MSKLFAFCIAALVVNLSAQQRIVLIEDFSASTCGPCASFDNSTFDPYLTNASNQGKFTCVGYRANWPGSGDPYYTAEAGTRISYYNVGGYGVPDVFIANTSPNTGSLSSFTATINAEYAKPAKATIAAIHQITGTTPATGKAVVTVTVTPTQDFTNGYLFMAVCEKLTTKNAASNGETQFHHVMMKMVPNASGKLISLKASTPVMVKDSASLSGTHIEEMNDLEVVVWVQISGTKEILQSAWSVATTGINNNNKHVAASKTMVSLYNPAQKSLTISNARGAVITFYDLAGKLIARFASTQNSITLSTGTLVHGCCIVRMAKNGEHASQMLNIVE